MSEILIVDDESAHIVLARRALKKGLPKAGIEAATSGKEALAYLAGQRERCRLVILDLNLGDASGIEVLKELRRRWQLADLPVIMLSTSDMPADIQASYRAGASCYLVKSSDPATFEDNLISAATFFWR